MKRALLWILAALAVGAVAGQLVLDDPGYVLVSWHRWVLETGLWIAVAGIVVVFLGLTIALGLLGTLVDAVTQWQQRRVERRERKARRLTEIGLAQYAEADWRKATGTLMKAAELVDSPLLVRLTSARAAEEDGRPELAEQILRDTRLQAGEAAPLVDVQLASVLLRRGNFAAARDVLESVHRRFPKHPRALRELADVYERMADWPALVAVLPALRPVLRDNRTQKNVSRGNESRDEDTWTRCARRACEGFLHAIAAEAGYASRKARIDALQSGWKAVPVELRDDEELTVLYADLLVRNDSAAEAQNVLERAIGHWVGSPAIEGAEWLLSRYGRLDAEKPEQQLAVAEKWLAMRATHAPLLLALGRISLRNKLWGKARDYFEASVSRQATAEACAELVRLYTRLGENSKADQFMRRHAELTGIDLPKLPLPSARI